MNIKPLYSVSELAKMSGIPRDTIYDWVAKGKVAHVKIGDGREGIRIPLSSFRDRFPDVWDAILTFYGLTNQ